jgi:4-hydroxy-tetrahydrodipicolinate reductase
MRIALLGIGRMGAEVDAAAAAAGHTVVASLARAAMDVSDEELAARLSDAEVAVDFSVAQQVPRSVRAAVLAGVDLVVGTTGWSPNEVDFSAVQRAGHGVVYASNFSLGIHVFLRLAREAARLAGAAGGYDVHVDEVHHRHKRDHPSGTAIRVAETLLGELGAKVRWAPGPPDGPSDPDVLYVTSVRAGDVPGTHVIGFEGADDRMELRHEASSRAGFAQGAVRSAEWIHGRVGVHTFEEVVADLLDGRMQQGGRRPS